MSRYDALTKTLTANPEDLVELSLEEIDELVDGLPPSARRHAAWWSNGPSAHQARYWLEAGRRAKPDFGRAVIQFTRFESGETRKVATRTVKVGPAAKEVVTRRPVDLCPTGEHLRSSVSYEWQAADEVRLRGDKLEMPQLTPRPGIYRFRIDHLGGVISYYVGESDSLFRRMGHYRNPGPTQQTNVRVNALLLRALQDGGRVVVEVVTAALCGGESLDFSRKWDRRLVENMAIVELERVVAAIENQ
jgi:hypothetical protein